MKKWIKILVFSFIILLIILFIFLYVNKIWIFNPFNGLNVEPKEIVSKLVEEFDFEACYEMDEEEVKESYYIEDIDKLSSFVVLSSYIGFEAEEIAIFKLKEDNLKDEFRENLEKRVRDIIRNYEGYSYSQTEIAKDYEIKVYNDVVVLVIHKNKEKIIKYIEKVILENRRKLWNI